MQFSESKITPDHGETIWKFSFTTGGESDEALKWIAGQATDSDMFFELAFTNNFSMAHLYADEHYAILFKMLFGD